MQTKPDFSDIESAVEWCREKYAEREKDLMGTVPPLEVFLMGVIEVMAAQAKETKRCADAIERYLHSYKK